MVTRRVLGIPLKETSFSRRGFRCDWPGLRSHLEAVGGWFAAGYHAGLEGGGAAQVAARIADQVPAAFTGFAYEGAGMALALLDSLTPWRRDRLERFLAGPGEPHVYLVIVGSGWALARQPFASVDGLLRRLEPGLSWLALDGYGFHEGYFHWPRSIVRQEVPRRLAAGYARRAFDLGLGRSLWFVEGGGAGRIAARIAAFPALRRPDLWSGVGLACAYAGGVDRAAIAAIAAIARAADQADRVAERAAQAAEPIAGPGGAAAALAQGVAFAAAARLRAGNLIPDTEMACREICTMSAEQAAVLAESSRPWESATPEALACDAAVAAAANGSETLGAVVTRGGLATDRRAGGETAGHLARRNTAAGRVKRAGAAAGTGGFDGTGSAAGVTAAAAAARPIPDSGPMSQELPLFEVWRQRIQQTFRSLPAKAATP